MADKLRPWHEVMQLRPEIRSEDFTSTLFVADLQDVVMGEGPTVYRDAREFFATTYATLNLRRLVKDVALRLAGKSEKAIRQLSRVYGGGKTHSLLALYHLMRDPEGLPAVPAVAEFRAECAGEIPRARVVVMPFDKMDQEQGLRTVSGTPGEPDRNLKHPWSIFAYQLAGAEGMKRIGDGTDAERDTAPAEPLIRTLLERAQTDGRAVLVLLDEVLMYARGQVTTSGMDKAAWARVAQLELFFQYLTGAIVRTPRCAMVASLLANALERGDSTGLEILQRLTNVFRREAEDDVQPVTENDIGPVLAYRFFTTESLRASHKAETIAALRGIEAWDAQTKSQGQVAEKSYADSFPFHPDLTKVFVQKWTNLKSFQQTRDALKVFAYALRDASLWDKAPLVGANVLLSAPGDSDLSRAARELTGIATRAMTDNPPNWGEILQGELERARAVQKEYASLEKYREVEQAVMTVFLHSQPVPSRASLGDISRLIGATAPDRIEMQKALFLWTERTWFLDDDTTRAAKSERPEDRKLPEFWRLGFIPNLNQIHAEALTRIKAESITDRLKEELGKVSELSSQVPAGVKSYKMPQNPNAVDNDETLKFVVLGPSAASEANKPSKEVVRYLKEAGPDRPRTHKNMIVCVVPTNAGIYRAEENLRNLMAWETVESEQKELDAARKSDLKGSLDKARRETKEAIRAAYTLAVAWTSPDDIGTKTIAAHDGPLFPAVKAVDGLQIRDTRIASDAILPDGSYDVWPDNEKERRVKYLLDAFTQRPGLPRLVSRNVLLDTLSDACEQGLIVLRGKIMESGLFETRWRVRPEQNFLSDVKIPDIDAVLPEAAELQDIPGVLLAPGRLPNLWPEGAEEITAGALRAYFSGKTTYPGTDGFPVAVPKASALVVEKAVIEAVKNGLLWLIAGNTGLLGEDIPAGILTDEAVLRHPPAPLPVMDLTPEKLPDAWTNGETTARALYDALTARDGRPLPWETVKKAVNGALNGNILAQMVTSSWPVALSEATKARFTLVSASASSGTAPTTGATGGTPAKSAGFRATDSVVLSADRLQDLADSAAQVVKLTIGHDVRFRVSIEIDDGDSLTPATILQINTILSEVNDDLSLA